MDKTTDILNEDEAKIMGEIAEHHDHPLLMMNLNKYKEGVIRMDRCKEWRKVNAEMIGNVGGKILWALPVLNSLADRTFTHRAHPLLADSGMTKPLQARYSSVRSRNKQTLDVLCLS